MRSIKESEVTFTIEAEQDHECVRGNAMASGDAATDKEVEDEIFARLDRGEVWAWASITVTATMTLPDGSEISGSDHLGCCSYADEEEFKRDGYYEDMKAMALDELRRKIEYKIAHGQMLAEMFTEKSK